MGRARVLARMAWLVLGLPALTLGAVLAIRAFAGPAPEERAVAVTRPRPPASPAPLPGAAPARAQCTARPSLIGTAAAPRIVAREQPSPTARVVGGFDRVNAQGSPQVFLLEERRGAWVRALLPVRPNGTAGWIATRSLTLSRTPYRVEVDRSAHRLTLWRGCERVAAFPVGVGRPSTPTPVGRFYLASLMRPTSLNSVYGAYAYGLSAYSKVLRDWRWGGVIGIHGTNDPPSIGRSESHGCVRLRNRDMSRLVRILPLGTPVTIR